MDAEQHCASPQYTSSTRNFLRIHRLLVALQRIACLGSKMQRASQKARAWASKRFHLAAGALLLCIIAFVRTIDNRSSAARRFPSSCSSGGYQLDVNAPPRHGRHTKHGPLGILTQLQPLLDQPMQTYLGGRERDFFPPDWRAARLQLGSNAPPPPFRVAYLMWSDKYKIIFVKCPKTAGML